MGVTRARDQREAVDLVKSHIDRSRKRFVVIDITLDYQTQYHTHANVAVLDTRDGGAVYVEPLGRCNQSVKRFLARLLSTEVRCTLYSMQGDDGLCAYHCEWFVKHVLEQKTLLPRISMDPDAFLQFVRGSQ